VASHLRTELVLDARDMAIRRFHPAEVIHHSDQGTHLRHLDRLRQALPGGRRAAVDGIGPGTATTMPCVRASSPPWSASCWLPVSSTRETKPVERCSNSSRGGRSCTVGTPPLTTY